MNRTALHSALTAALALAVIFGGSIAPPTVAQAKSVKKIVNPAELFDAVKKGDRAAIDAALKKGININSADEKDNFATALLMALRKNDFETAKYLVAKKADVSACFPSGCVIHQAARDNNTEAVIFLVENGARLDAALYNGETALSIAALKSNERLVEFLLAKGADPNPGLTDSPSLLNLAKKKGNQNIINMLEKAGGKDHEGITGGE
jgi:uncharacterized protein